MGIEERCDPGGDSHDELFSCCSGFAVLDLRFAVHPSPGDDLAQDQVDLVDIKESAVGIPLSFEELELGVGLARDLVMTGLAPMVGRERLVRCRNASVRLRLGHRLQNAASLPTASGKRSWRSVRCVRMVDGGVRYAPNCRR